MRLSRGQILWWNLNGPGADRARRQLDLIRRELSTLPDVFAFAEVLQSSAEVLREELAGYSVVVPNAKLQPGQRRSVLAIRGEADPLPLDCFMIPREHPVKQARGFVVWPRSIASARAAIAGTEVDIHAVHIPNGSSNQWIKIDHLWALRYGLADCDRPQIVAGDFNTPQAERDGKIITFGQRRDGSYASETYAKPPYTVERPWDSRLWDEGERAVLEGLPQKLDMPDAFRKLHPGAKGYTWGPRGRDPDRRLDHVFVSKDLGLQSCEHLVRWSEHALSDHCPILVGLAPSSTVESS